MTCTDVRTTLVAYLDGEVTPSERRLLEAHLAGCAECQRDMAGLSALQSRTSQFLRDTAVQVSPSPQAWSRLQARLARDARPLPRWLPAWAQRLAPRVGPAFPLIHGGPTMKQGLALMAVVALAVIFGTVATVPPVRAQAEDIVRYVLRLPGAGGWVTIEGKNMAMQPLVPSYLPAGLQRQLFSFDPTPGSESVAQVYHDGSQFVAVRQSRAPSSRVLPTGRQVTVNGQPGVVISGLKGTVDLGPPIPEGAHTNTFGTPAGQSSTSQPTRLPYADGKQLTWYVGETKVELLSNLSEQEMLGIAASLRPSEDSRLLQLRVSEAANE